MFKFNKVETHLAELKNDENRLWRHYIWHWPSGMTLKFNKNEVWLPCISKFYILAIKREQRLHIIPSCKPLTDSKSSVPQEHALFHGSYKITHYFMCLRK